MALSAIAIGVLVCNRLINRTTNSSCPNAYLQVLSLVELLEVLSNGIYYVRQMKQ